MKLYLVIVLVLCGSYADDELPEDIADLLSQFSDDFNHQLQKRLTDLDPDLNLLDQAQKVDKGKLVNDKGSSCFYEVSEQRIIRTHDSLNNGATYIDSPTEIQNQTACRAECCTHSECDLAVFKDKGDEHACYLFACNGACLFTNHTGFTTMEKRRMAQQHEADLANLATDPPSTTVSEATTTTTTESTTSPTPTTVRTNKAPLFGSCIEDSDCGEIRTECLAGYCVCQQGSHAQGGVCREECSRFQFECANEGKPLSYPQCIAIYDTCDGIPHCRDGSDELKCDPRSSSSSDAKTVGVDASFDELASLVEELLEDAEKGRGQKTSGDGTSSAGRNRGHQPGNNTPIKGMNLRPQGRYQRPNQPYQNSGNSHVRVGPVRKNPQLPDTSKAETSAGQDRTIVTRPKGPPSNLKNKIPSHPEAPSPTLSSKSDTPQDEAKDNAPLIPKDVPVKEAPAQVAPKASATSAPSVETSPDPVTTVKDTTNKKPPHSGGGTGEMAKHVAPLEHVLNDAEKEPSVKASNKTAVVVLAMGLAVTALLLIFVGCRLRMVKRRLRRGRPLNSNEADYLINGMYL